VKKCWLCPSCGYLNNRNRPGKCAQRGRHGALARAGRPRREVRDLQDGHFVTELPAEPGTCWEPRA
jgi:transposase